MNDMLELLMKQVDEERIRMVEDLGEGKAQDYAQYQFSAGVIRGLLMSQRIISDMAKRLEHDDSI